MNSFFIFIIGGIGLTLADNEVVNNDDSLPPICGAVSEQMELTQCANNIINANQPESGNFHVVACANTCQEFSLLLNNPPWELNSTEATECSTNWTTAASGVTDDRSLTPEETESYFTANCSTEPGCCSNMGSWFQYVEDECGVRDGDGSSCADCAGTLDVCNVCDGDGSSCADCAGTPNGNATLDVCSVCDGDGSSCSSKKNGQSWNDYILFLFVLIVLLIFFIYWFGCCRDTSAERKQLASLSEELMTATSSAELETGIRKLKF